jgi:hypothetical protein
VVTHTVGPYKRGLDDWIGSCLALKYLTSLKSFPGTNALAYFDTASVIEKYFTTLTQFKLKKAERTISEMIAEKADLETKLKGSGSGSGTCLIKPSFRRLLCCKGSLACFSFAKFFRLVCLIFAGTTISLLIQ